MAGFSSIDNLVNAITVNAQKTRTDFFKTFTNAATSATGRLHEAFTGTGIPGAGSFSGAAGAWVTCGDLNSGLTNAGAGIEHGGDVSPMTKHILTASAWTSVATIIPGQLMLVDLLGYHPSLVVTGTPTTLSAPTLPARDNNGSSNGDGVQVICIVQTALGAASPQLTLTYTPSDGTGSQTASLISPGNSASISTAFNAFTTSSVPGTMYLPLAAGKKGVRSIASYAITNSSTTGTVAFAYVRPIATVPLFATNTPTEKDFIFQMPSLPRIYDKSCLMWIALVGGNMVASTSSINGSIEFGWN